MSSNNGIVGIIRENYKIIFGAAVIIVFGVVLGSISVNIEPEYFDPLLEGYVRQVGEKYEALITVIITNEAPYNIPAVVNYFTFNVKIEESSINARAFYKTDLGDNNFPDKPYYLGYIGVTASKPCTFFIKNINEKEGRVNFTIQVYTKKFGYDFLIKEKQLSFIWESLITISPEYWDRLATARSDIRGSLFAVQDVYSIAEILRYYEPK